MKPEPVFAAMEALHAPGIAPDLSHARMGRRFPGDGARIVGRTHLVILLSGHYEGIDQRIRDRS
jgi:tRNA (guanine37-N1)-methyltransferase